MTIKKTILITGCSSGIGACVAHGLKARGYRVFPSARNKKDVEELVNAGFQEALLLNLDDSGSIQRAVNNLLTKTNGQLFALFNNAAYGQAGAVEDLTRDALRANFETNLFGTHELTALILPVMRKQGYGRIIQNSSVLGLICLPYRGAYNATKYALEALTDTLRMETKNSGISISLIEPGPIKSRFRENAFAAYQKNINKEKSFHRKKYETMEARLTKKGPAVPFTLPPDAVLKKVIHALESDRPKIRYYVTFPTYLFATLKRCLPHSWLERVLMKVGKEE